MKKAAGQAGPRRLNLMTLIDPAQDVAGAGGKCSLDGGRLLSTGETSHVEAAYTPPDEYDYRIEFTADHEMKLWMGLWKANKSFMWLLGNADNKHAGFDMYKGLEVYEDNPTLVKLSLDKDTRHTTVVEGYNDRIRASVDGQVVRDLPTNYKEFSQNARFQYAPRDNTRLSLGTWNAHATFYKIEVIELSGPGTVRR